MRRFPLNAINPSRITHARRVRKAHERRAAREQAPDRRIQLPGDDRMGRVVRALYTLLEATCGRKRANHMPFDIDVLEVLYRLPDDQIAALESFSAACIERRASYIDAAELAAMWAFSPREIASMAESGELRGFLRDGQWTFRQVDIDRYLAENLYQGRERLMRKAPPA